MRANLAPPADEAAGGKREFFCHSTENPAILAAMPKPNYSFQKRQRELEKKRKKAEKEAEKAARSNAPSPEPAQVDPSQPVPEVPKE
jgi:hypothetical protein